MILYIVIQEGVYRHCITGVFDNLKDAKMCALNCIKSEIDNYHEYYVSTANLNTPMDDVDILFKFKKTTSGQIKMRKPHFKLNYTYQRKKNNIMSGSARE